MDRTTAFIKEIFEIIHVQEHVGDQHALYEVMERTLEWAGVGKASGYVARSVFLGLSDVPRTSETTIIS